MKRTNSSACAHPTQPQVPMSIRGWSQIGLMEEDVGSSFPMFSPFSCLHSLGLSPFLRFMEVHSVSKALHRVALTQDTKF